MNTSTSVMILCAGLGKRMHPLTLTTPKPLLKVHNKPLVQHHLDRLSAAGFTDIIINVAHLGEQLIDYVAGVTPQKNPSLTITISDERASGPLETAGGIIKALPLIKTDPFLVINGDIYTDLCFERFVARAKPFLKKGDAYLALVDNPAHHPQGDFGLEPNNQVASQLSPGGSMLTFSGIGLYKKCLFEQHFEGTLKLAKLLHSSRARKTLFAEHIHAKWHDIGTPERLAALNQPKD